MNANTLNPFPDYPVTRLLVGQASDAGTVITLPIEQGRRLVDEFTGGIGVPLQEGQTSASLCAVRGDYGTGKTFLLNDVASHIRTACGPAAPPSILRATCIEAEPLSWFKSKVGPRLNELPLDEIALRLYGQAGRAVAASTAMTESAARMLEEDPRRIRDLIRRNTLSVDEVDREFRRQLETACTDYDETVRRVLSRLVSSETERLARMWISGATLAPRDAELLGVPVGIDSADQVSSVIGAIAAMHKAVGRPFVLLVDELEHFVRHDVAHNSRGNITWLKRLLEHLGSAGALALVAGHWDAWNNNTTKDYLDRFPQHAPIDLNKLGPEDVTAVVRQFLGTLPSHFGDPQARTIAAVTNGIMRRVMSLCNLLFRQNGGFAEPLTDQQIHAAWTSLAQRIPLEQALEEMTGLLESRSFETRSGSQFNAIPFDLVAERADGKVVLVEAKHASSQNAHYDAARRFIDKLDQVVGKTPGAHGIFLANGSIDDELLSILQRSGRANLRWFDLTTRDVLDRIRVDIAALDGTTVSPAPTEEPRKPASAAAVERESEALQKLAADFEKRLHDLDERRNREVRALQERLEQGNRPQSPRQESIRNEAPLNPERARASYEAMLEPPSTNRKLRYLGPSLLIGILYFAVGLVALLLREPIIQSVFTSEYQPRSASLVLIVVGITFPLAGLWSIWHRYSLVTDYFEFSRQTIRDLYLRDVPIPELTKIDATLRRAIERDGLSSARRVAVERLLSMELQPRVTDYLRETLSP